MLAGAHATADPPTTTSSSPAPADNGPAAALTAVRTDGRIGAWLNRYENTWLDPERRRRGGWIIHVGLASERVGRVTVSGGRVVAARGPWDWDTGEGRHWWLNLRSTIFFKHVACLLTVLALVFLLDLRQPASWRNVDLLVLAGFVPAMLLVSGWSITVQRGLLLGTAFVAVRLAIRGLRPTTGEWPSGRGAWVAVPVLAVALAWRIVPADLRIRLDGPTPLILVSHLATIAALACLVRRAGGRWSQGVVLAAAYVFFAISLGRFFSTEYVAVSLVMLGLLAWPNPYLAGLCLGSACAAEWTFVLLLPLWIGSFPRGRRLTFVVVWAAPITCFVGVLAVGGALPGRIDLLVNAVSDGLHPSEFWPRLAVAAPWSVAVRWSLAGLHVVLCVVAGLLIRRPRRCAFAAFNAAVLAGLQVWLPGGWEQVGWFLAPALFSFVCGTGPVRRPGDPATAGGAT